MTIKTYQELELEVDFDHTPYQAPVYRDANGTGDPGHDESIEITDVRYRGNPIELTPEDLAQVEESVWDAINDATEAALDSLDD